MATLPQHRAVRGALAIAACAALVAALVGLPGARAASDVDPAYEHEFDVPRGDWVPSFYEGTRVDGYGSGPSTHVGTRDEVCATSLPPGTAALGAWLRPWPRIDAVGILACRLIADDARDRNGRPTRWVVPGDQTVYTNWSSHATGQAIDFMTYSDVAAGDAIVDYLLATRGGVPHLVARRLGVLQVIWYDGCWDARRQEDRLRVHSAAQMRTYSPCSAGRSHRDHPHITLTAEGAQGLTSGYADLSGAPPLQLPADALDPGPFVYDHYARDGAAGRRPVGG